MALAPDFSRATITNFMGGVQQDFARPNLFQVDIDFPGNLGDRIGLTNGADLQKLGALTVKATTLPASTIGVVEVPFRGRMLKIAGDRTFEPWSFTVQNDTFHALRTAFQQWMEAIQIHEENATRIEWGVNGSTQPNYLNYMANMRVSQLDRRGNVIQTYLMADCWPSNVSAIDVDFGSNDSIEEFTVEWQVQYWYLAGQDLQHDINTTKVSPTYSI